MLGNIYGLDLGTYEIKVYDKKKDTILWVMRRMRCTKKRRII